MSPLLHASLVYVLLYLFCSRGRARCSVFDVSSACRCAHFKPSGADLAFTVKVWPSQPILGIRILADLDGKDFDVCVSAALDDIGQCETFPGSSMQQMYYLSQTVLLGKYVTIRVPDAGENLNVCELEILAEDDCATPASTGGPTPEPTAPAPTGGPTPEPTAPAPTGGPTPEPTAPAPTGGPTPEPTAPAPTGGPTPEPTAPAPTGGPTPEPTAPAPTGGPTPEPTAPAPTGGPTPEPTAPAPTGGPTPEPTAPAPTGGPTPDGTYQQPPTCDTDSAIYFIDIILSGSDTSTQNLASSIGCTLAELKQRIAEYVDSTNSELAKNIASFKSEMDKSIDNFLSEDIARVRTLLQAATSSATSAGQMRMMTEVVVGTQLNANSELIAKITERAVHNGIAIVDIRKDMVEVLTGAAGKAEAVQRLAGYAAGAGGTLADEKMAFIDLQAAAIRQSKNAIETVNSLTTAFGTSQNMVGHTIATILAASTGTEEGSAIDVIEAVASSGAGHAAAILLTGLNGPVTGSSALDTVLATARINEYDYSKMKNAMDDFIRGNVLDAKVEEKIAVNLHQLESNVHDLGETLKGAGANARKKVSLGEFVPPGALRSAEAAANSARLAAKAGARKASASAEARY